MPAAIRRQVLESSRVPAGVTGRSYFGIRQDPSAGFEPPCHLPPSCFMTALTRPHACPRNRRGLTIMPCMPSVISRSGSHVESSWRTRSPRFLVTKDFSCSCLGLAAGVRLRLQGARPFRDFLKNHPLGALHRDGADIEGLR